MLSAGLGLLFVSLSVSAALDPPTERYPSILLREQLDAPLGITSRGTLPALDEAGLLIVKDFEGWSPVAYDDPSGFCTIGYGHLIAKSQCRNLDLSRFDAPMSPEAGEEILILDMGTAKAAVSDLVSQPLETHQYTALASFVFNVGYGNFRASTMRRLINAGEMELASLEFPRWIKSDGQILNGLITRRACERALFEGNTDIFDSATFDRSDCDALGVVTFDRALIDLTEGE